MCERKGEGEGDGEGEGKGEGEGEGTSGNVVSVGSEVTTQLGA